MTNKEMILNELKNNVKKFAELLIDCEDNTSWDEIPCFTYITSDKRRFDDDFNEALKHEIEWLNSEQK